jgi:hypothetical protein
LTGISRSAAFFAEADHGVQRGVQVEVLIVGRELHDLPEPIVGADQRAVQAEGHRPVCHQLERRVVDLDHRPLVGAAWHQAHG